jgi:hypothetical protein
MHARTRQTESLLEEEKLGRFMMPKLKSQYIEKERSSFTERWVAEEWVVG